MVSCFWGNMKMILSKLDRSDTWLIKEAGLGKTAIINGQKRNTYPAVDKAYRCAKALGVTIEVILYIWMRKTKTLTIFSQT